ncbi:TonB-dependent siderophore receptor [Sphingopyxis sp. BSNA05]|uniref:TonB-dependent receptor plug domain-containing protein n=1 Tax=Sphingopyxis sp. BSNA05 TaxID=1236614 RepID=UPI001C272FD9|nr:TonB-dependent receptor plug domain-containing protein [Sphingopyxis sp. BSNA05]
MCTTALFATGTGTAFAQEIAAQDAAAQDVAIDENVIVVTGSQIKGAKIDDILPVTVLDEVAIEATGADSGDDLFRAIPQAGTVEFNDQSSQSNSPNAARGDIASINLRGLGTGNTLLLINGRRMVLNPGFQTELFVPVVSSDTNEIAPGAVRRIEVLRDGASALYGADAVAGVVNTILKDNLDGGFLRANYAASMGTSLYNSSIRGGYGFDFNEGRSNLTLYGYYYHENGARLRCATILRAAISVRSSKVRNSRATPISTTGPRIPLGRHSTFRDRVRLPAISGPYAMTIFTSSHAAS